MDFSLLQPHSRHRLLRDVTSIQPRWLYYGIMIVDPLLRFAWIFYAIFTYDAQHSTIVSFMVAFAEATRRGMWTLFRVDNEHCANVAQYRASRDVPLPYQLEPIMQQSLESIVPVSTGRSTGVDISGGADAPPSGRTQASATAAEEGQAQEDGNLRMRRADTAGHKSISRIIAEAHKQDFEKRRKPTSGPASEILGSVNIDESDDDDDDAHSDDDEFDEHDAPESQSLLDPPRQRPSPGGGAQMSGARVDNDSESS
jgi:hypothetical protein